VLALGVIMATPTVASADRADDLVVAGQQLAVDGKYDEAIAKFREADAVRASALHACLIGLAQLRSGRLDAAELEFAACRKRSTASDPVPEWLATEERKLAGDRKLADDRKLAGDRKLAEDRKLATQPAVVAPARATEPPRSRVPVILLAGGAGLAVAGAIVHLGVLRPARDQLAAATTSADYDTRYGKYNVARIATVGLYALSGVSIAIGAILYRRANDTIAVGMRPLDHGGLVTVEWQQ